MTINEVVFLLLKESIFDIQSDLTKDIDDCEFWNKVYCEMKAQTVAGLTTVAIRNHNEIPINMRRAWSDTQRLCVMKYV